MPLTTPPAPGRAEHDEYAPERVPKGRGTKALRGATEDGWILSRLFGADPSALFTGLTDF